MPLQAKRVVQHPDFSLDDPANCFSAFKPTDQERLWFLHEQHDCEILLLVNFRSTPINSHIASELLNILAFWEHGGSSILTSQFDPQDYYRSLQDAVIAESNLNRFVSKK